MIDTVQAVLLFVILLLTIILVVLGVQVFFILRDVRSSIARVNKLLDTAEDLTQNLSEPMSFISGIISSTRSLSSFGKILSVFTDRDSEKKS